MPPELPAPSAELILLSVLIHVWLSRLKKRDRALRLREISDTLRTFEEAYAIIRFRASAEDRAVHRAQRQASAWWRQILGVLSRMGDGI